MLYGLARGRALVYGRLQIDESDLPLVFHSALSSMPLEREKFLRALLENGGKITTDEADKLADDLVRRNFTAVRPGQRLVGAITYIAVGTRIGYLATVIDLASRRVAGFAMADHMRASLVCDALAMAIELRRPAARFIFHSDRGSQYTSGDFRSLLAKHHGLQSLSRPRQCWDNAVAESFFATLKEELVYRLVLPTREAARRAIFEFIEVFYNRSRLHSSLGYLTPAEYEKMRRKSAEAA